MNQDNTYQPLISPDEITPESLGSMLDTDFIGSKLIVESALGSTNDLAKEKAKEGAQEGLVVIAAEQTKGKGRLGRLWHSGSGGLYFSVLTRPQLRVDEAAKITLLAAVTIVEVLRSSYRLPAEIKWPNDILIQGKKVCGILAELSANIETVNYLVLGIGINCNQEPDFFQKIGIAEIATSLALAKGCPIDRLDLLAKVLTKLEHYYKKFTREGWDGLISLVKVYTPLLGQTIHVIKNQESFQARALDITDAGGLVVQTPAGKQLTLWAADVSIRQ